MNKIFVNKYFLILISLVANFYEVNASVVHNQRENLRIEFKIMKIQALKYCDAYENFGKDFKLCENIVPRFELAAICWLADGRPCYCLEYQSIIENDLNDITVTDNEVKVFINLYKGSIKELKETIQIFTNRLVELKERYRK
ncbi:hypothetical protein KAZ82_00735 [Candidatus Babeliales bacterium]|nr:hypothetical protein [Candidatus Babeliales bacterium]